MNLSDIREEIEIEMELVEATIKELLSLRQDVSKRNPTVREKTAAATFLAQCYTGIENILKRICKFYEVPLPTGTTWHVDLFNYFCESPKIPLPCLFDSSFATALIPFRKFRHVVFHGYGFQLEWKQMQEGIERIEDIFYHFRTIIYSYLQTLESYNKPIIKELGDEANLKNCSLL
ncbi:MAG: hypothetical protein AB1414_01545 [bacterium]